MKTNKQNTAGVVFYFLSFFLIVNFPEVVTLVLTKSASCSGVERVTDLAKFQVRITKDEAQTPLLFCSHDYCSRFRLYVSLPPPPHIYFF